jgi:hypothetical protein
MLSLDKFQALMRPSLPLAKVLLGLNPDVPEVAADRVCDECTSLTHLTLMGARNQKRTPKELLPFLISRREYPEGFDLVKSKEGLRAVCSSVTDSLAHVVRDKWALIVFFGDSFSIQLTISMLERGYNVICLCAEKMMETDESELYDCLRTESLLEGAHWLRCDLDHLANMCAQVRKLTTVLHALLLFYPFERVDKPNGLFPFKNMEQDFLEEPRLSLRVCAKTVAWPEALLLSAFSPFICSQPGVKVLCHVHVSASMTGVSKTYANHATSMASAGLRALIHAMSQVEFAKGCILGVTLGRWVPGTRPIDGLPDSYGAKQARKVMHVFDNATQAMSGRCVNETMEELPF